MDGAVHLRGQGFPAQVVSLVAFHSGACFEADRRGLTAELNQFPDPDSVLLDAVTCADMLTSPDGDPVTAEARLADIFSRYSPGTPVSDAVNACAPELLACVDRCRHRFGSRPAGDSPRARRDRGDKPRPGPDEYVASVAVQELVR